MMASAPSSARALGMSPSVPPRCTPAAPTALASTGSSLTISGTPWAAHRPCRAAACSCRSASLAVLLRYCSQVAPAASSGAVRASRRAVSGSSGVIR